MTIASAPRPVLFRAKLGIPLLLCISLTPIGGAQSPPAPREAPLHLKLKLVDQINADRRAHGLPPVKYSVELSRVADEHCREMLLHDYVSHWNREGWKPYLRYTQAGLQDYTSENISSVWSSHFPMDEPGVLKQMLDGHKRFLAEKPPNDGHRRSVLTPGHQSVGIGVAFHETGMRMIEVFGRRDVQLEALEKATTLRARLDLKGQVQSPAARVFSVSIFYEPLPRSMTRQQLQQTYAYGLPEEENIERPQLTQGRYTDGTRGSIFIYGKKFELPVRFWRGQPGVYTIAVWLAEERGEPYVGGMTSVIVEK